ncbi:hypothetical protein [Amycolatopsis sp. CB00013]|uniref:hypothetical protein n=1 Tax=Amycolatopsis sp. CB00013 TaxID=1703945 RepID=UPI00093FDC2A|nr:hypothetical protein [Amycolatopsis sp. CB00013]OKJ95654.1 hypothetical protein AMK34_21845 [Amycolatopsis sp. CB00013]
MTTDAAYLWYLGRRLTMLGWASPSLARARDVLVYFHILRHNAMSDTGELDERTEQAVGPTQVFARQGARSHILK